MSETALLPQVPCPCCSRGLDAATDIAGKGKAPKPGDISLCIYCGEILIFGNDLNPREMTEIERFEMEITPDLYLPVMHAQRRIRERAAAASFGGTATA